VALFRFPESLTSKSYCHQWQQRDRYNWNLTPKQFPFQYQWVGERIGGKGNGIRMHAYRLEASQQTTTTRTQHFKTYTWFLFFCGGINVPRRSAISIPPHKDVVHKSFQIHIIISRCNSKSAHNLNYPIHQNATQKQSHAHWMLIN